MLGWEGGAIKVLAQELTIMLVIQLKDGSLGVVVGAVVLIFMVYGDNIEVESLVVGEVGAVWTVLVVILVVEVGLYWMVVMGMGLD